MKSTVRDLSSYRIREDEVERIDSDFPMVCENANLLEPTGAISAILKSTDFVVPGVYFWTMTDNRSEYKIYVGKTKSLRKRVTDYSREFQPHSVNDYKLQIFQQVVTSTYSGFTFNIRFCPSPVEEMTSREKDAINLYRPLLNERRATSHEAKTEFLNAFVRLYSDGFRFTHNT